MRKREQSLNKILREDLLWVSHMIPRKKPWTVVGVSVVILIFAALGSFFSWQKITGAGINNQANIITVVDRPETKPNLTDTAQAAITETKNLVLAGIPGAGNSAPFLTDTLIIASVKPDGSIYLFSLPRDLLVSPPGASYYTKINSIFSQFRAESDRVAGEKLTAKLAEISGLQIKDFVIVDLNLLKQVVDYVGGVDVKVTEGIIDSCFPGPNYTCLSYSLEPGDYHLNGEETLKFVRSRHSGQGDFSRIARQQQVLEALKKKVAEQDFFTNLNTFCQNVGGFFEQTKTSLSLVDFWSLWQTIKNTDSEKIHSLTISNQPDNGLLQAGHFTFGNGSIGYVLTPKAGVENYTEIQDFIAKAIK